ncbi:MAG: response regulator [Pseudoxanthomonas sp.]|nr:response regulator [Pseudoxanthomonas sp.]
MNLKDVSVLIVEDEVVLAMMLEDYFIDAGARVVGPAMTVTQALALVETHQIDVAILDLNLRGERSEPVGAALKQKDIPYIYATGYGTPDDVKQLDAVTLRKPYHLAELESAVVGALGRGAE